MTYIWGYDIIKVHCYAYMLCFCIAFEKEYVKIKDRYIRKEKKMKKILAILLALMMASSVALVSCDNSSSTDDEGPADFDGAFVDDEEGRCRGRRRQ